mmetsp:Transcript_55754/g.129851  ORF Transcript_55754/g.129851 Transcript_55754/m.129851 type:complete len:284 (+) Transcript_55754:512-1363(+)
MIDACLHVDEHLRHALKFSLVPVKLLLRLREIRLEVVYGLPSADVAFTAKLELLDLQSQPPALLSKPVNRRLVLFREVLQVLLRVFLREELLDDLIGITDACGLLNCVDRLLVVLQLLPFLVRIVVRDAYVQVRRVGCFLQLALALLVGLLLRVEHLFTLLQALVHLHSLLHQRLLLLNLLVSLVPLLHDALLKSVEFRLGHLLGMIGVVGEQQQLLVVTLLRLQGALYCSQLVVEANPLFLETLHYGLIRLADTLCFVVLDHGFVQPVLKHSDLSHLWRSLA